MVRNVHDFFFFLLSNGVLCLPGYCVQESTSETAR